MDIIFCTKLNYSVVIMIIVVMALKTFSAMH